jgi:hypothetical protein
MGRSRRKGSNREYEGGRAVAGDKRTFLSGCREQSGQVARGRVGGKKNGPWGCQDARDSTHVHAKTCIGLHIRTQVGGRGYLMLNGRLHPVLDRYEGELWRMRGEVSACNAVVFGIR